MSKKQSQQTTENDLLNIDSDIDPIKLKNFDLSRYLIGLISYEPFYSRILRSVNKVESETIQTAGVSTTVDKITLFWNRKFLASLDDKKIIGVLKHECLHLLYDHTTFRKRDPHIIWNYATDLSINTLLNPEELPSGGLIPGIKFEELTNEKMSKMNAEQIERYNKLSELIGSFPPEKSADWYFEKLMNDDTIKEMIEKGEQQLNELKELLGKMDDHDAWGEMTDDEREQISQKIKEIIKDANIECQSKNSWGSVHQSIQKEIRRLLHKEISWKDVLKRFVGFSSRNERTQTITRLNRKYPGIHAGIMKEYKPKIAVYIDESGSVDDNSLEKFFGELHNLSNFCNFTLFKFDTFVDDSTKLEFSKGKKYNLNRQCFGGTDFNAPTIHANKTRNEFDGMIIMTDGEAPKPEMSRIRRCWVLCNNNDLYFGNDAIDSKDFIVKMTK